MKKIISLLLFSVISISCLAQSTSNIPPRYYVNPDATYQLFPTQNRWNFIKLNTQTGQMWMVQYSTSDASNMFTYELNEKSLLDGRQKVNGRFTLYPTQNIYNFILLDQIDGRTWQVQWSTKAEDVGIWQIL